MHTHCYYEEEFRRAANITLIRFSMQHLFKGGYYLKCGIYWRHVAVTSVITQSSSLMRAAFAGDNEGVVELVKAEANLDLQDNVCDDNQ